MLGYDDSRSQHKRRPALLCVTARFQHPLDAIADCSLRSRRRPLKHVVLHGDATAHDMACQRLRISTISICEEFAEHDEDVILSVFTS